MEDDEGFETLDAKLRDAWNAITKGILVKELQVVDGSTFKYINVETFSKNGIENAKKLGLVSSKLADIIVSPLFQESLTLFVPSPNL